MKTTALTFALLAATLSGAVPASAQRAALVNDDKTLYCQSNTSTVREIRNGRYALNYYAKIVGDGDDIVYAKGFEGMFLRPRPHYALLYTGLVDDNGVTDFYPFAITASFGDVTPGRLRPPGGLRIQIFSDDISSPLLTLSTTAREENQVNAALVGPGSALDGNDVQADHPFMVTIADSMQDRGATLVLTENGRELARVKIRPGDAAAARDAALAYADRAYPLLKQGKCPN